jgi:multidrug efflux pump subunit AcrB
VLRKTPGTRDVNDPSHARRTDLRVTTDLDKAALLGVRPVDVDRAVRLALGGVVVSKFREAQADEAYDVRVTLPRSGREPGEHADLDVLQSVYVPAAGGGVPLAQIARLGLDPSPTKLRHRDKERSVTVTAEVLPGYNTDRVTTAVVASLAKVELPRGVRMVVAGEVENRKESFGGLGMAILISAFGVLAILVLEFRTFKSTVIVASVIPLGIIGGLLALFLSGNTLSFTASIGFIALMGIEVKNSILLVDYANELRRSGLGVDEAIQKAGETRFVPILLTTLTAIGGLIPLVLERSSLYSPLALVILGGLVSSTFLTRLVTPVLYKLLAPEVELDEAPDSAASRAVPVPTPLEA